MSDRYVVAPMTFDDYQQQAAGTRKYPPDDVIMYPTLGLVGEAGEVANKLKKVYRDGGGGVFTPEVKAALAAELGDVLWYAAALAADLGFTLADVARGNLDKLAARAARGTLGGSGDDR